MYLTMIIYQFTFGARRLFLVLPLESETSLDLLLTVSLHASKISMENINTFQTVCYKVEYYHPKFNLRIY